MLYKKVTTDLNFIQREKEIEKFWKDNKIFEKTIEIRENQKNFTFYDGPPTANGKPHIGHVLTRVIKDMFPRYKTMKGFKVLRKAGWDTHGLPVEIEVEKKLGLESKDQIEKLGLETFINECKKSVWVYKDMWERFSSIIGFFVDMENPYITYDNNYIESVWWSLKQIWEKRLLYKGFKVVPYCPRCGTPLSSHEVAQGYKDVKEKSCIAKFKVKNTENDFFLAWTTTPWTLPSNLALCVNPNEEYVKVECLNKHNGKYENYILAKNLTNVIEDEFKVLNTYLGKELENTEYIPLFETKKLTKKSYFVVCDDFVTLNDGTGIVHIAPAFGEDDNRIGRKYNLDFLQLVNSKGEMSEDTLWPNIFCKDADKLIIETLKTNNNLFKTLNYEHSYPYCWRCDSPLIYYARESWFIKMSEVKEDLIKNNNSINWIPQSIGTKRFGDWLENIQDWSVSRDRYWGTPLNLWHCSCGHVHAIGSIEELKKMSATNIVSVELHKPFIDNVFLNCPKCNQKMQRVKEVIDCWYDSGAMPFAQWHYPFENKEIFDQNFPADFISEAVDQTRGWFYSLLAISTLIFNKAPFKNCLVLGHVQDENGQKMSKSKGNAIDPFAALEEYGADAIRWYFTSNSAPWLPNRFHGKVVIEGQRKILATLQNTYAFYCLYANIDNFNPIEHQFDYNSLTIMDKWIYSKLNTLVKVVDENLSNYKIVESTKIIEKFIDDLSNWYIRRNRERFWASNMEQDKVNAYLTLYNCLVTLSKALAPILPFITESIYQNLVVNLDKKALISIHLCDYPKANLDYISPELEEKMEEVLDIVVLGRNIRNTENIKNRQPLSEMFVRAKGLDDVYSEIIKSELNIKKVTYIDDISKYSSYKFKPNFKTLGSKYGKILKDISQELNVIDSQKAYKLLNEGKTLDLYIQGNTVSLTKDDLLIETVNTDGFSVISERDYFVCINKVLTQDLIEEGIINEVISKVQTMRKEALFEVTDNINLYITSSDFILSIIKKHQKEVTNQTLTAKLFYKENENSYNKVWDINDNSVYLGVEKI